MATSATHTVSAQDLSQAQARAGPTDKDTDAMETDTSDKPVFTQISAKAALGGKTARRKIVVPPNRFTPLKNQWKQLYTPLVDHMKLKVRMNLKSRCVELKTGDESSVGAIQKGSDFLKAFMLGFDVADAIALLRMDELYFETFQVKDIKTLKGDHLSRAVGRLAGRGGKTKYTIENTTKTRIVLADTKIHILGSYQNVRMARTAIVNLIRGSQPGKVYGQMRGAVSRMTERF